MESYYDMVAIGAGVIQTFLYLDFFYIYATNKYDIRKFEQLQTVVVWSHKQNRVYIIRDFNSHVIFYVWNIG